MGQYFYPVILAEAQEGQHDRPVQALYSHEYGYGLKLGEHGTQGSGFVELFEILLALDGARRVVWTGDYAQPEPGGKANLQDMISDDILVHFEFEELPNHYYSDNTRWTGPRIIPPLQITADSHPYVLNHDKRLFVDKRTVGEHPRWPGERWHPLVALTVEGSSVAYYFDDPVNSAEDGLLVGAWARDHISVSETYPSDWEELKFTLR